LRERIALISGPDTPCSRSRGLAPNELLDSQRALTRNVIGLARAKKRKSCAMQDLLDEWMDRNAERLERYDALLGEIRAAAISTSPC